jgi:hypothetical protein
MKLIPVIISTVLVSFSLFADDTKPQTSAGDKVDLSGAWNVSVQIQNSSITKLGFDFDIKQVGSSLTGTATGKTPLAGVVDGTSVTLTNTVSGVPQKVDFVYSGKIADKDTIKGKVDFGTFSMQGAPLGVGNWTATRKSPK